MRVKGLIKRGLRVRLVSRSALGLAALRGHGLVLLYHRVTGEAAPAQASVTPSVSRDCLRMHIQALGEIGDIVALPEILRPTDQANRPRFALTFDDDEVSHVTESLPLLHELGVPATFFLSGRALHGLGPYWWQRLEQLVDEVGVSEAGRALGVSGETVAALAALCERDVALQRRLDEIVADHADVLLQPDAMRSLATSGMTIGFHTVCHELLTGLDEALLERAMHHGRPELERLVSRPMTLFAYPHGKADARVAQAARAAGFTASWTGWPRAACPGDDLHMLGRWEPGPVSVDELVAATAIRLHRAPRTPGA
jgi:peptidoglycan/xylan/chitin deacetylase (PgdA/CDA1 family)